MVEQQASELTNDFWMVTVYAAKSFKLELEKMTVMNRYSNRPGPTEVVKYH